MSLLVLALEATFCSLTSDETYELTYWSTFDSSTIDDVSNVETSALEDRISITGESILVKLGTGILWAEYSTSALE